MSSKRSAGHTRISADREDSRATVLAGVITLLNIYLIYRQRLPVIGEIIEP